MDDSTTHSLKPLAKISDDIMMTLAGFKQSMPNNGNDEFEINGETYYIDHDTDGFFWFSATDNNGETFETFLEALQDAMNNESRKIREQEEYMDSDEGKYEAYVSYKVDEMRGK